MGEKMNLIYFGTLPGLNEIIKEARKNRYAAAYQKKKTQEEIATQLWPYVFRGFGGPVNIHINFYEKDRRRDEDNVMAGMKFILDAIVQMGVIPDDSQKYCHVTPAVYVDKEKPRIEILIEDREENV